MDSTPHHDYMAEITDLAKENKKLKQQLADDEDGCVEDCVIVHSLQNRLNDWIYELAYYTEDEVATPKGVKKFVGKALEDKVKEIKELLKLKEALLKGSVKALKERDTVKYKLEELQKEVKELREENGIGLQVNSFNNKVTSIKYRNKLYYPQAQPNALKASEVKPKPLSEQRIEEIIISLKTEHCINPDCDRDGTPTNRCGGCWDCVLDQVLDRVAKNLAEAIYKEMNAQSNPTERSK